jgi:hypothetical protein
MMGKNAFYDEKAAPKILRKSIKVSGGQVAISILSH